MRFYKDIHIYCIHRDTQWRQVGKQMRAHIWIDVSIIEPCAILIEYIFSFSTLFVILLFFFFLLFSSLTWKISYLIAWVLNSQTIRSLRRAASPTTNFIYFLQVDGWKLCLCSMYSMTMFEYDDHGFERLVEHWISLERRKYQMVQIQTKSDSLIYTRKKNIRYTHTHTHTKMYTLCINRKCVCATACRFCTIAKAIAIAIFMTRYIGKSTLRSTLFIRFCEPTSYPTMRKMRKIFQNDARARNNNIVDGNGRYFKQTIRLFRWEKEI